MIPNLAFFSILPFFGSRFWIGGRDLAHCNAVQARCKARYPRFAAATLGFRVRRVLGRFLAKVLFCDRRAA